MAVNSPSRFSFLDFSVKSWMWIYLWSCYNTSVTGEPLVIGSSQVVLARVGDDVILPCHIEPPVNMEKETVEWTRPDLDPIEVNMLQDGRDMRRQCNPSYKERAFLFNDALSDGNISLKLSRVQLSDQGKYVCKAKAPNLKDDVEIQLRVVGGSQPSILWNFTPFDFGLPVNMTCNSSCWSPPPEMSWLDSDENPITTAGPSVTQNISQHCYIVQRNVTLKRAGKVTCRVHLPGYNITAEEHENPPEFLFLPETKSYWTETAIAVTSTLISIIILSASVGLYLYWRKSEKKSPQNSSHQGAATMDPDGAIPEETRTCLHQLRCKTKKYIGRIGLLCAYVGVVPLVVATMTNNWLKFKHRSPPFIKAQNIHTYQSLWQEFRCKDTTCFPFNTPHEYAKALIGAGIALILSGMLCVIGIIIGVKSYAQKSEPSKAAAILFLFSSALVLLTMIVYSSVAGTNLDMALHMINAIDHWSFSWSWRLCWVAFVMILLAGISTICAHRIIEKEKKNERQEDRDVSENTALNVEEGL